MSVAKKSHAFADGLARAQQEILQRTWVAFAISAVNLCVIVEAVLSLSAVLCKSDKCTRKLRDPPSIVDHEPQEHVLSRNRPHCYIGKRRVVLAF